MLDASRRDFDRAFRKHKSCYEFLRGSQGHEASRCLLLVYAAECGLKSKILRDKGIHTYSKLRMNPSTEHEGIHLLEGHHHDLAWLMRRAKCGGGFRLCRISIANSDTQVEPGRYHEFFRYGLEPRGHDEVVTLEKTLTGLVAWLDRELVQNGRR